MLGRCWRDLRRAFQELRVISHQPHGRFKSCLDTFMTEVVSSRLLLSCLPSAQKKCTECQISIQGSRFSQLFGHSATIRGPRIDTRGPSGGSQCHPCVTHEDWDSCALWFPGGTQNSDTNQSIEKAGIQRGENRFAQKKRTRR